MGHGYRAPAQTMRLALLPALLALAWPAAASAQSCSLKLLNSVKLTVDENVAWVPATVGETGSDFQIDTAAPDNQIARDEIHDFGLTAIDFTPAQTAGNTGSAFMLGQAQATDIDGQSMGATFGSAAGGMGSNAVAIYDRRGVMFHSMADAKPFILGSMKTDTQQFVVTTLPPPGYGGVLAATFFQKYDIDLNFSYHKLNMFSSDHCPGQVVYWRAPAVARLPFRFKNGHIIVRVTVDGREMDAAINTGSPRSEMEFDDVDSFFYLNSKSSGVVREGDGNLGHDFAILSFGPVSITRPHLVLTHSIAFQGSDTGPMTGTLLRNNDKTALQPELTIGTDLLKLLHVYIAFKEHMVYITQGPELAQGDAHAMPAVAVTPFRP